MHTRIPTCAGVATGLLMVLLITAPVRSQPGLVHSSPDGIYVALGNSVLPAEVEGRFYSAYRIERREKGETDWTEIARVASPETQLELELQLRRQFLRFPEQRDLVIDVPLLWQRLQAQRTLRDIGRVTRLLPVQLALGVRWLDTTVQRAKVYEYRIGRVSGDGGEGESFTTPSIVYPGIVEMAPLRVEESYGETVAARVLWRAGAGTPPSAFRVYRRDGITGAFRELQPFSGDSCCTVGMSLLVRGDSVFCSLYDKSVQPGLVYQYYAVPMDYFRNEGDPSDTVSVITFQMRQVPLPEHLKAVSVDTAGIEIRWKLREPSAVHGIVIERGPAIDTGFVELYTAGPADTSFLDMSVIPMERYYYRLRLVGPGGLRSVASAVVIGIFRSSESPTPPNGVRAEAIEGGVRVSWFPGARQQLKGYYVFRGDGFSMPLRQVSGLIPPDVTAWIDTSSALQPAHAYMYALQAENSSHRTSAFSDTVSAIPIMPVVVPAPAGVRADVDGNRIHVSWNTSAQRGEDLLGYRLYRMRAGEKRLAPVADTLQEAWQNYHVETETTPGGASSFAVRAVSITGDTSAFSATAVARIPAPTYYPPGNLRAQRENRSVRLQWDEIVQQGARALHVYRYERGKEPTLLKELGADAREYVDSRPGRAELVSYYLTTVGTDGTESARSRVVTIPLR